MRTVLVAATAVLVAGCGQAPRPAYLDPTTGRASVIASLDHDFCSGRMKVIEDAAPYWVGLCQNRSAFEDRVFFMAFDSRRERDFYLEHLESCFDRGRYAQGPRWFAMAVTSGDAGTLRHGGGTPVRCGA